jgi:hypothetical protein
VDYDTLIQFNYTVGFPQLSPFILKAHCDVIVSSVLNEFPKLKMENYPTNWLLQASLFNPE